jgi:hypothetical protein
VEKVMTKETEKTPKAHYLVLEDLSYANGSNIVNIKKGVEDVFLDVANIPQEALSELVERELVKVITI